MKCERVNCNGEMEDISEEGFNKKDGPFFRCNKCGWVYKTAYTLPELLDWLKQHDNEVFMNCKCGNKMEEIFHDSEFDDCVYWCCECGTAKVNEYPNWPDTTKLTREGWFVPNKERVEK
jgi:hypothetical protein